MQSLLLVSNLHRAELGSTPRFLYTVLAIANLGTIVFTYLTSTFAEYGLFFVTGGRTYLNAVDTTVWGCKLMRASNLFSPHVLNWTYLILNLERLYAVLRPLDAHVRWVRQYMLIIMLSKFASKYSTTKATNEESNSAANSNDRNFLYNSKGLDVNSLLVKYFVPLAHINKVIKLLKFKYAVKLLCF